MYYNELRGIGFTLNKELVEKFEAICKNKKSTIKDELIKYIESEVSKNGTK